MATFITILSEHPGPVGVLLVFATLYAWVRLVQFIDGDEVDDRPMTNSEIQKVKQLAEFRVRGELRERVARNFHRDDRPAA
jgi:hypothetical protein